MSSFFINSYHPSNNLTLNNRGILRFDLATVTEVIPSTGPGVNAQPAKIILESTAAESPLGQELRWEISGTFTTYSLGFGNYGANADGNIMTIKVSTISGQLLAQVDLIPPASLGLSTNMQAGSRFGPFTPTDVETLFQTLYQAGSFITGRHLNDVLEGGNGNDHITGGQGGDSLIGGFGNDRFVFDITNPPVANSAQASGDTILGGDGTDTLYVVGLMGTTDNFLTDHTVDFRLISEIDSVEVIEINAAEARVGFAQVGAGDVIKASFFNDGYGVLTVFADSTDAAVNADLSVLTFQNWNSARHLVAVLGTDSGDTITGTNQRDVIVGRLGTNILDGGGGADDTAFYKYDGFLTNPNSTGYMSLTDHFARITLPGGFNIAADTLLNFENITGSDLNDTIIGDEGANRLAGGGGDDLIQGLVGNDTLISGPGNRSDLEGGIGADSLVGETAFDVAYYWNASSGISVDLQLGTGTAGEATGDTLVGIDHVLGSNHGDTITGSSGSNQLFGGLGTDRLDGGLGNDTLDGGDGFDAAYYWEAPAAVTVYLTYPGQANGLAGDGTSVDTLVSIEAVIGSEYDDLLAGNVFTNQIYGWYGNDTLTGEGGADLIDGGAGNDTIIYDPTDNPISITGGADTDTLMFLDRPAPTSFNLTAQQFERAEGVYIDTGSQWWYRVIDIYNVNWQLTNKNTLADDGRYIQTTYDVSPGGTGVNWQHISDYRTGIGGTLTNQDGLFDDGSTFAKSYDYAAGTAVDGVADWLSEYTYFFRNIGDQAIGKVRNVEGFADDGRKFTQTNDIDANQPWQYQTDWYKVVPGGLALDFKEILWDDGRRETIPY